MVHLESVPLVERPPLEHKRKKKTEFYILTMRHQFILQCFPNSKPSQDNVYDYHK